MGVIVKTCIAPAGVATGPFTNPLGAAICPWLAMPKCKALAQPKAATIERRSQRSREWEQIMCGIRRVVDAGVAEFQRM